MNPITIYQNRNVVPIVDLNDVFRLLSASDASPNGAMSGVNTLLQNLIIGNKTPLVIVNQGLNWTPATDFVAWVLVASGNGYPNPNSVDLSIQFQPDQVINLF